MPESPSPLLGRDILSKVHASVFMNMEPSLSLPLMEQNVNPRVWADGKSVGRAQNAIPVVVKLKDPHLFPHKKQYPLKPEVKEGLKPIIKNLKEQGLLVPCNSPCVKSLSHVRLFVTLWTVGHQAALSMGFPRQEYCCGLPFPTPGDLPDPGIKHTSPASAGRFFTTATPGRSHSHGPAHPRNGGHRLPVGRFSDPPHVQNCRFRLLYSRITICCW